MDPYSGQLYRNLTDAPPEIRDRLVTVEGPPEHVERVSRAVAHYGAVTGKDKAKRRAANKAARRARRRSR